MRRSNIQRVAQQASSDARLLFTAVRNEAPFLLEWIAYHKAIGFERIIVFSNDSDDGTDELLAALAGAGEIEHHPHVVPAGVSPQGNAARLANERGLLADGAWVLWLDADEFLVVRAGAGRLDDLIAAVGDRRGVLIPWRLFGDGGNPAFPGRFVSSRFVTAARKTFRRNHEIKTLFQAGSGIAGFAQSGINRPLIDPSAGLTSEDFLSGRGVDLDRSDLRNRRWLAGEDFAGTNMVTEGERGYALAQINHYCVRTPEHFALKKLRGRGWAADQAGERNLRHTAGFYQRMNRNDVEDRHILRFEAEVTAGIAALRRHAAVKRADDRARKRVAGQIAALPAGTTAQFTAPRILPAAPGRAAPDGAALLARHAFDPDLVIDVGVDQGTPYLYAAFPDRRFILIDPLEECGPRVRENWPGLRFDFHAVALGGTEGEVEINIPATRRGPSPDMASILNRIDALSRQFVAQEARKVRCARLDDVVAPYPGRCGLKIDTEGFEYEVLKGAQTTLARCDFVILELSTARRFEELPPPSAIFAYLAGFGFEFRDILGRSEPVRNDARLRHIDALFTRWA